jgi:hypothetical protein
MSTSYSSGRPTAQLPSGLRGNSPLGLTELVNGAAGVVIAVDGKLGRQRDGQAAASPVGSTG